MCDYLHTNATKKDWIQVIASEVMNNWLKFHCYICLPLATGAEVGAFDDLLFGAFDDLLLEDE